MADTNQVAVSFRIHSIDVPHYICTEVGITDVDPEDIALHFGWSTRVIESERLIEFVGLVNATTIVDSTKLLFNMVARCFFEVKSLEGFERDGDLISMPRDFVITIMSITYSTMRGMLFERLASTVYRKVLLPPTDHKAIYEAGPTVQMEPEK